MSPISNAKFFWNNRTQKRSFFLWRLNNCLIPFKDKLINFGIHGPFKCPFYNNKNTLDHSFLNCHFARSIWHHFESCFNLCPSINGTFNNYITRWYLDFKSTIKDFNHVLPNTITWHLWKIRNKTIYDNKKATFPEAINALKTEIFAMSIAKPFATNEHAGPFNIFTAPTNKKDKRPAITV
ncbi:unnamed protein product [Cuscuta epithymum]|uniref:Reverse transcriptase zinc-binding domain-containing protein n=1 Tax=Cuscuta epithymum TaxID=186058 RepID=A0AAV0DV22_9ASTE|nr:unnamed protein product [Cuscuta epithymum]